MTNKFIIFWKKFYLSFMDDPISFIITIMRSIDIPIIFLVGWRGYLSGDAPEHKKIGEIQPDLIKILKLPSKVITEKNWKNACLWAIKKTQNNTACALIIRREFLD